MVWPPEIVFLTLHQVAEPDDRRCRRRQAELSSHLREMCRALVLDHDSLITTPGLVQALHAVDPGVVQQKEPLDQVRYCIALHAGHVDQRVGHGHRFHYGIHILARLRGIAVRHVPQHNIWRQHIRRASAYTILIKPLAVQSIHGCRGKSVKGVRVVAEEPTPTLLHRGRTKGLGVPRVAALKAGACNLLSRKDVDHRALADVIPAEDGKVSQATATMDQPAYAIPDSASARRKARLKR